MRPFAAFLTITMLPASVLADGDSGCKCVEGSPVVARSHVEPEAVQRPRGHSPQGKGQERGMSAQEHGAIFDLLSQHDAITRTVTEIPGGVQTVTTTNKPELVVTLRTHVRQMADRLKQDRPVRMWDPVFRGVFAHSDEITLSIMDIDGGVEVTETSKNPEAISLIRAHAAKVNSFVAKGHAAARPPWAGGGPGQGRGRMGPPR